jgi:hypothetical protein
MSRKMNTAPVKLQNLWSKPVFGARKVLGIELAKFSPNTSRCLVFVNDAEYRREVMAVTAKNPSLTVEQADDLLADAGLSFYGRPAIGVYKGTRRVAYLVSAIEDDSTVVIEDDAPVTLG